MLNKFKLITVDLLSEFDNKSRDQAKSLLNYYEKSWKLLKVKRGVYLNPKYEIDKYEISNFVFKDSYISLDNILFEEGLIKQYSWWIIYSISKVSKTEEFNFSNIIFRNYKVNIDINDWIIIWENNIWKATKERALLDLLYLKFFSKNFSFDNEIYLSNIDFEKLKELAPFYWKRILNYINKNVIWQKTLFLK